MMTIPPTPLSLVPATLLGTCPGCSTIVAAQLQVLAERLADVAKLPRLMLVCGGCQRTFVVAPPLAQKRASS